MLRTALLAVLLTGVASTALASDRVRVIVSYDSGYHHTGHGYYSGRDRGYHDRGYRHRGRHYGYDRRWDRGRHYDYDRRWDRGRHYGWNSRYHYSPRPYYRSYDRYRGGRHGHDRYYRDRWHRH